MENNDMQMEFYLQELRKTVKEENAACIDIDAKIKDLQEQIEFQRAERDFRTETFTKKANELRQNITQLAMMIAQSYKSDFGNVSYRKGYVRRSYDAKALDILCASSERLKTQLWPHRKESTIEPNITIDLGLQ